MMRPLLVLLLVAASACSKPQPQPPAAPPPKAPVAPVDDCTAETKLVPGIPGSPGHLLPSERNPNGDSELAALMRAMESDLRATRLAITDGGAPPGALFPSHRKIRCSWPTDPRDRNPTFDGLAINYLARVKALDEKPLEPAAYEGVLEACKACHQTFCPGPVAVIDSLSCGKGADAGTAPPH